MKAIVFILFIVWKNSTGAPEVGPDGELESIPVVFCDIPDVENAQILPEQPTHETYRAGKTITVKCKLRYHTNSVSEFNVTCKNDGKWNRSLSLCKELSCEAPDVKNARIEPESTELETYKIGMGIDIVCLPGFHFQHMRHFHFICMDDGTWDSDFPVCEDVTCDFPKKPENGQVVLTNKSLIEPYPFGSEVTYSCNPRYVLEGPEYRWCEASGWSNKDPHCKAIECEGFPAIENGRVSPANNNIFSEEEVPIQCNLGYKPAKGTKAFLTCTTAGQWDISNSSCSAILCDPPLEPEHGSFKLEESGTEKKSVYEFADRISYYCDLGYSLNGKKIHTCRENGWTDLPPKCEAVRCPVPPAPSNGWIRQDTLKEDNYEVGNLVVYQCHEGYKLIGNEERMCTERGWDGVPAHCIINSCAKPKPSKGFSLFVWKPLKKAKEYLSNTSIGKYFGFGDKLTLQCQKGYRKNTNQEAVCLENGEWSINIECVAVTCGMPTPPRNGWIPELHKQSGTIFAAQFAISYKCKTGYSIQGPPNRLCTVNGWTPKSGPTTEQTTCQEITCPQPESFSNGEVQGIRYGYNIKYPFGSVIVYNCHHGYTVIGNSVRNCTENGWSGRRPFCQELTCPQPEPFSNGEVQGIRYGYNVKYPFGTVIVYNCHRGYTVIGDSERICTENGWSGPRPFCQVKFCLKPETVQNGEAHGYKYSNNYKYKLRYKLSYYCYYGYTLIGDKERFCTEDGWSGTIPLCQEKDVCQAPESLPNGGIQGHVSASSSKYYLGDTISYYCDHGYTLFGKQVRTCTETGWSGTIPICQGHPIWQFDVANSQPKPLLPTHSNNEDNAENVCHTPEQVTNGWINGVQPESTSQYPLRTRLLYNCNQGYTLIGEEIRTCTATGWSGTSPICQANFCDTPEQVTNGWINDVPPESPSQYQIGYKISYNCTQGYTLVGEQIRTCTTTGWSGPKPICKEQLCAYPEVENGGVQLQHGNLSLRPHGFATVTCNVGFKLRDTNSFIECSEDGHWKQVQNICKKILCDAPRNLKNGFLENWNESYPFGFKAVYRCSNGYQLHPPSGYLECSNDGWHGSKLQCIVTRCQLPEAIDKGQYRITSPPNSSVSDSHVPVKTILTYSCLAPNKINGETEIRCLTSGLWSAGPPTCESNYCTKPQINNTEPIGGHFRYQPTKKVTMQCIAGYKLVNGSELECQEDGTWKPSTVICQEILCTPPSAILFGKIIPVKKYYKYGDTIQYRCNYTGVALNGTREHKCTENGWDGDTPSCIVKKKHNNITCSCPKDLSVKVQQTCGSESMFQVGESISLGFDSTNDSSEVSEIICSPNGTWFAQSVNQSYTKGQICPQPPSIRNANLFEIETSYHIGATAYIICDDGFRLFSEPDYLTCQPDGTWNNSLVQCEPAWCKPPISPANGSIENVVYEANYSWSFGSEVHFRCKPGFQLHGHHWLKCMENGWSGSFPTCKKISCVDPDTPEEGRKLVESLSIGSKSLFGCFSGYHLIGSKERICLNNGQWSGIQPRCETGRTDCPVLSAPENGVKSGSQYNEYDAVSFTCNSGFVLIGSKRRICKNGSWTESDSYCIGKDQFNVQEEISRNLQQFLTELSNKQRRIIKQKIQEDLGLQKMAVKVPKRIILYIILDASSSIGHINFQRQKDFSRALIEKLDISQSGTRVGVITFSSRATAEFYPNDFHSKHNILDALNKTTCKTNGASLQSALEILGDMIEETNDALTEGLAENYVFILTDGKAKGGLNPLGVANRLKERHAVHFTCISLTGQARKDILYGIASDHNHAYFLDSYSTMDWLTDQINRGTLDYSKCGHLPSSTDLRSFKEDIIYPWPWTVLISYGGQQKCKGSLISHKWVLTSGSCVDRTGLINPKDLSLELELSKEKLQVETIHVHPEYYFKTSSMSNNAALILLKDGMGFTNEIRPVCLPSSVDGGTLYKPGEYGHERFLNGKQSSSIIMNKSTCKAALLGEELSDNTFCAQHTEDRDANDYNQGGSLNKYHSVSDGEPVWIQIGITSYYQGNLYKYFTNVLNIMDWITAFVKN